MEDGHPGRGKDVPHQRQAATQEVLTAAWKEGAMMTCLKEGLGMVARVGKTKKQQSLKMVSLLELEILALPAPSPALT